MRPGLLLLLVLAGCVAILPGRAGRPPGPVFAAEAFAAPYLLGDTNCDTIVNAIDSVQILRASAALEPSPACITLGNVNCDAVKDAVDALNVLRLCRGAARERGPVSPDRYRRNISDRVASR